MPIPSSDEMLVKEEIKAAILEKALIEVATEFSKRDPNNFGIVVERVIGILKSHPVERFVPPARAEISQLDVKRIQNEGFALAIEAANTALRRIVKRIRPLG